MKQTITIILFSILLLTGCKKSSNNTVPPDSPSVITITTPPSGTVFLNGSTLQVRGNVSDNNALETVRIEIRSASSSSIYYQQNQPTGNVTYFNLAWNWTVTGITGLTNAIIKITITDRYGYIVTKEIPVVLID